MLRRQNALKKQQTRKKLNSSSVSLDKRDMLSVKSDRSKSDNQGGDFTSQQIPNAPGLRVYTEELEEQYLQD